MRHILQWLNVSSQGKAAVGRIYQCDRGRCRWGAVLLLKDIPKRDRHLGSFKNARNAKAAVRKADSAATPAQRAQWLAEEDAAWEGFFMGFEALAPVRLEARVSSALETLRKFRDEVLDEDEPPVDG